MECSRNQEPIDLSYWLMTCTYAHTQFRQYAIVWLSKANQFNILIFSEIKVKTDLFILEQRQRTRASFHVDLS